MKKLRKNHFFPYYFIIALAVLILVFIFLFFFSDRKSQSNNSSYPTVNGEQLLEENSGPPSLYPPEEAADVSRGRIRSLVDFFIAKNGSMENAGDLNSGNQVISPGAIDNGNDQQPLVGDQPSATDNLSPNEALLLTTTEPVLPPSDNSPSPSLFFGSLYNNFVSTARLDLSNTDLHRDSVMTAVTFRPDYSWATLAEEALGNPERDYFAGVYFNEFNPSVANQAAYYERRCLEGACLEQRGNQLYFQNNLLSPPLTISGSELAAVSIGSLARRWLVGFTVKTGNDYLGRVFYFDGIGWQEIIPGGVTSRYFGRFGFGGEEDDFLVIYGAYLGQAFRIRPTGLTDISEFFSYRVMNNGFKAEVVKAGSGARSTWYVYSLSWGRPRLVKLWQNGGAEIAGALVFSGPMLPQNSLDGLAVRIRSDQASAGGGSIVLLTKMLDKKGVAAWAVLEDRGFHNKTAGQIQTASTNHDSAKSLIAIKKIDLSSLELDDPSREGVKLWFKPATASGPEPGEWRPVPLGRDLDFQTDFISHYILRVTFEPVADKFSSPFLLSLSFNYYCAKED